MPAPSNKTLPNGSTFLVGDVGGTRTRLMIDDVLGRTALVETVLPSQDFASFEDAIDKFLAESKAKRPMAAAFGVVGPVQAGTASITNLPWVLDEKQLAEHLGIPRVHPDERPRGHRAGLPRRRPQRTHPPHRVATGQDQGEPWSHRRRDRSRRGAARMVRLLSRGAPDGGRAHGLWAGSALEVELWTSLSSRFPDHASYERVRPGLGSRHRRILLRGTGGNPARWRRSSQPATATQESRSLAWRVLTMPLGTQLTCLRLSTVPRQATSPFANSRSAALRRGQHRAHHRSGPAREVCGGLSEERPVRRPARLRAHRGCRRSVRRTPGGARTREGAREHRKRGLTRANLDADATDSS